VHHTDEWIEARNKVYKERDCQHENTPLVERIISDGRVQHVHQCSACGKQDGSPVKQEVDVSLPNFESKLSSIYEEETRNLVLKCDQFYARRQIKSEKILSEDYHKYLKSDAWNVKRQLVLAREDDICEGCRLEKATDVHHKTYQNFMDEFLFELVALCRTCHERIPNAFNQFSEHEDHLNLGSWETRCSGCRWGANYPFCGLGDGSVKVFEAIKSKFCKFEGLK